MAFNIQHSTAADRGWNKIIIKNDTTNESTLYSRLIIKGFSDSHLGLTSRSKIG